MINICILFIFKIWIYVIMYCVCIYVYIIDKKKHRHTQHDMHAFVLGLKFKYEVCRTLELTTFRQNNILTMSF